MEPLPAEVLVTSRPNPLESSATIGLALPAAGNASLDLYDVRGRRVATIASGLMPQANHDLTWNGVDDSGAPVASGAYFLRVRVDGRVAVMHKLTKL
jgi:flagellar hook assembly protein FlgD